MPTFRYEIQLGRKSGAVICGVDEAGRGPLAGPVVACAAILPLTGLSTRLLGALDDSKRLSSEVRETIAAKLRVKAFRGRPASMRSPASRSRAPVCAPSRQHLLALCPPHHTC